MKYSCGGFLSKTPGRGHSGLCQDCGLYSRVASIRGRVSWNLEWTLVRVIIDCGLYSRAGS